MKVLHLDSAPTYRGGQRQVRLLAAAQHADPTVADPVVLCRSTQLLSELQQAGVAAEPWAGPAGPQGLWQLRQVLRRWQPDRVHAHDSRALGAARLLVRIPSAQLLAHRRIDDVPRTRLSTRWKYSQGTILCVSEAVAGVMERWGTPRNRLWVVPSAVEMPPSAQGCRAQPWPRPRPAPLRLLCTGALVDHKGHSVLLDALTRTQSSCHLTLIGQGHRRARLRAQITALGLEDRTSLASGPYGIEGARGGFDLAVQPSLSEGLGTAVLDAMAAELPVLVSDVGGLPELVDETVGWRVRPGDADALARSLDRIQELAWTQPSSFLRLGQAGRRRVEDRHSIPRLVQDVQGVYDSMG